MIWLFADRKGGIYFTDRPAALRAFNKRGDVKEERFHAQISRIENSQVIRRISPLIINTFDSSENFKDPAQVLSEIMKGDR